MSPALVEIDAVACGYGAMSVLAGVSLTVGAGEMVAVVGPNGAGKTTLLRAISGSARITAGSIRVQGLDVATAPRRDLARVVAVLPQESAPAFPVSVLETVLLARTPWRPALAFESAEDVRAAEQALASVDAIAFRDRDFATLSGGERQRVLLARALCQGGRVLLCDEPTSHLDPRHQEETFALLAAQRDAGRAVVVVTHDLESAVQVCDRFALVAAGELVAVGGAEEVLVPERTRAVFGVGLSVRREGGSLHVHRVSSSIRRNSE